MGITSILLKRKGLGSQLEPWTSDCLHSSCLAVFWTALQSSLRHEPDLEEP